MAETKYRARTFTDLKEEKKYYVNITENTYLPEGKLLASAENRDILSSVSNLEAAAECGKIIEGVATLCNEDMDLVVDLGVMKGIIPKEEVTYNPGGEAVKDIAVISRVGKAVCFRIIGFEKDENRATYALLSRKAAQRECMYNHLLTLSSGDIIDAKVTHLEHFGAFVDIGCGVVSLLSIDCISVSRISHPRDRFSVGMPIKAVIKSIDRDLERIYVTHKELLGTWQENVHSFCSGQTVMGIVRSVEEYGIFIELAPNLAGLAEYRADITPGQSVAVYIKNIIPERMKIKLVIIDIYKGKNDQRAKFEYFLSPEIEHIDYWRYSPDSAKLIETRFL